MAKAVKKAAQPKPQKRKSKYDTTIKLNGSFDEVMNALSKPIKSVKKK